MIQSIIKRDGRIVLYDQNKIAAAILKALEASGEGNAMDAASKNAGEMIEELSLKYNRARQGAITQELTEIVSGAAAV